MSGAQLIARVDCDTCGDDITGDYFPGVARCDNCTDNHGLELAARDYIRGGESRGDAGDIFEPLETDSLSDCLQDIARGLGDTLTFGAES